jgi:hypothetical protein
VAQYSNANCSNRANNAALQHVNGAAILWLYSRIAEEIPAGTIAALLRIAGYIMHMCSCVDDTIQEPARHRQFVNEFNRGSQAETGDGLTTFVHYVCVALAYLQESPLPCVDYMHRARDCINDMY